MLVRGRWVKVETVKLFQPFSLALARWEKESTALPPTTSNLPRRGETFSLSQRERARVRESASLNLVTPNSPPTPALQNSKLETRNSKLVLPSSNF
jgi:hypothetical protein